MTGGPLQLTFFARVQILQFKANVNKLRVFRRSFDARSSTWFNEGSQDWTLFSLVPFLRLPRQETADQGKECTYQDRY